LDELDLDQGSGKGSKSSNKENTDLKSKDEGEEKNDSKIEESTKLEKKDKNDPMSHAEIHKKMME
jgi:hypothetical protein